MRTRGTVPQPLTFANCCAAFVHYAHVQRSRHLLSEQRMNPDGPEPNPLNPAHEDVGIAADEGDLTDMLGELRVLLPGAQLLSAFLITVPFSSGFASIVTSEKSIFLATFMLSILSLVLLSAPAVQHRVIRPLTNRRGFKRLANSQIIVGAVLLAMALTMATQLVLSSVFGHLIGVLFASVTGATLLVLWWILPKALRARGHM